jgi:hypothetical protein
MGTAELAQAVLIFNSYPHEYNQFPFFPAAGFLGTDIFFPVSTALLAISPSVGLRRSALSTAEA